MFKHTYQTIGQAARKLTKHFSLIDPIGFYIDFHQSCHMYPLGFVESLSVGYIYLKFLINRSRSRLLLGSYFSCIDIFFNKMHFTCIWVVLDFEIQTELASRTTVTGNQFFKLPKKMNFIYWPKKKKCKYIKSYNFLLRIFLFWNRCMIVSLLMLQTTSLSKF